MTDRAEQDRRKIRAAYVSVGSNSLLLVTKLVVGVLMGSVAIVSEAIHSGIDLLASLMATYAVREAAKPPDDDHEYGHGKFEDVSGTVEAALIIVAAAIIIWESLRRLAHMEGIDLPLLGMAVMGASVVINWGVSSYLFRVARETESVALEADALHLRTDVYTSAGVMVAMLVIHLTDWYWVDPVVAMGVAVLIAYAAYELTRRTVRDLVDAPLPAADQESIEGILHEHHGLHIGWDSIRTRRAGPERHIDLHLHFPPSMAVKEAHDIAHHIQEDIEEALPRSHVLIHMEPCIGDCKACVDDGCEDRGSEDRESQDG